MHFTLRHLRAFQLSIISTWAICNCSTLVVNDACPDSHSGRLSIDECHGYIDCMNGVEIDRALCHDGMLYSAYTENCEAADTVTECNAELQATRPATTTNVPVLIDDSGMWVPDSSRTSSTQPQVVYDGNDAVAVFSTTAAIKTTPEAPVIADDEGTWVPESTETSTTPHVVNDGSDVIAPSTTVPAGDMVNTTPRIVYDGTDATAIWSTTQDPESTQSAVQENYQPNRAKNTCIPVDSNAPNRKRNLRRLPSIWEGIYPTKDECCGVYSYNQKHYDTCINN